MSSKSMNKSLDWGGGGGGGEGGIGHCCHKRQEGLYTCTQYNSG